MNRLLNYLLLLIVILIFAGLVIPFAILQVQVNTGDPVIINKIINIDFSLPAMKNALIAGILVPVIATILLGLQQYFYIKNLKTKMEYPVSKNLIKNYQWVGISTGGLIALSILFFVIAFCVGKNWDVKKWLYIGGMIVTSIYGILIYMWATIVNMKIVYDQAKQQAIVDAQNNDKNPPQVLEKTTATFDREKVGNDCENEAVSDQPSDVTQQPTSGNF